MYICNIQRLFMVFLPENIQNFAFLPHTLLAGILVTSSWVAIQKFKNSKNYFPPNCRLISMWLMFLFIKIIITFKKELMNVEFLA